MLLVKAGQLLDARTEGGDVGVRALYALIADPGDSFDAVLSQRARLPATPLGDLRTLTTAAVAQGAQLREITDQGTDDAVAPPSSVPPTPPPSPVIAAAKATISTGAPRPGSRPTSRACATACTGPGSMY